MQDAGVGTLAHVDAEMSRELFHDGRRYTFVGIFGHWLAIGYAYNRPLEYFYLGSAID